MDRAQTRNWMINRCWEMFKAKDLADQEDYHAFCRWAKNRSQAQMLNMVHKKIAPELANFR